MNSAIADLERKRQDRADLHGKLEEISERAVTEKRELSGEESREFRRIEREFDKLTREIRVLDEQAPSPGMTRSIAQPVAQGASPVGVSGRATPAPLGEWLADRLQNRTAELRAQAGEQVEQRTLATTTGFGDALTPPDLLSYVFDFLAAESVGLRAGFRVIDTDKVELLIPHATSDPTAAWTAENTQIPASDPGGETLAAVPHKLAARVIASNEVIKDSVPTALDEIARRMLRALALKLDLGFFEGAGSGAEPTGLKNVSGIQTVSMGTNGAAFTNIDPILDAIGMLAAYNARAKAIFAHPNIWRELSKLKTTTNSYLLDGDDAGVANASPLSINGVPVYLTSQISTTDTQGTSSAATSAYVVDTDQVVVVRRQEAVVEYNPYRLFDYDQTEVRGIVRYDMVVPNPKAVVRIVGAL